MKLFFSTSTSSSYAYKKMSNNSYNINEIPLGITILKKFTRCCCPRTRFNKGRWYKLSVLFLTYIAYVCYHMTRKPISVVKSVLHQNCSLLPEPDYPHDDSWCDYKPFEGDDAKSLFGYLDSAFLFSYAIAMFISGYVAERSSIRYFLAGGMLLSGFFTFAFGLAKTMDVHTLSYFIFVQIAAGIFQTTGWPGVVTVVGRWFGKSKRGLIFGIWNSHTSIGNILGTVIAAHYVINDWSRSFIVPGVLMSSCAIIILLFMVDSPELVGLQINEQHQNLERRPSWQSNESGEGETTPIQRPLPRVEIASEHHNVATGRSLTPPRQNRRESHAIHSENPISLGQALLIPGVVEFSLCLFFSKLVSYTFLFWLPMYIQANTELDATGSADLSTVFDVGGILGAIIAGGISDVSSSSACTCAGMLILALPTLLMYNHFQKLSLQAGFVLLFFLGILVNGPYALITTSVSAELGTHSSLVGNAKALATVTAIIDGTGSLGAAVGPLLTGLISNFGWTYVFYMLIGAEIMAISLLTRLVFKEIERFCECTNRRNIRIE